MADNPNSPATPPTDPPNSNPPEEPGTANPKTTGNPRDALDIARLEYLAQRGLPEGAVLDDELAFVQGFTVADDGSVTGTANYRPPASAAPVDPPASTESPQPAPRSTPAPSGGRGGGPAVSTAEQVESVVKDIMEERLEAMGYAPRRPADDAQNSS